MDWLDNKKISVEFTGLKHYPMNPPYHPSEKYPEYQGTEIDATNEVYGWVRTLLYNLGLDKENYGSSEWNPFKEFVQPGMTVLIKPNTVRHYHLDGKDIFSIVIHASVLRPVLDYVEIALKGEGKIIIGDSHTLWADSEAAFKVSKIDPVVTWFRNKSEIPIELLDLRMVRAGRTIFGGGWNRPKVEQDPLGYVMVDLGERSYFHGIDHTKLRLAVAGSKDLSKHHNEKTHEYLFPKSVLAADVIISIPKLKTHRRNCITMNMKSFIGLPALKSCLPHYRLGALEEGGDEYLYPSLRKRFHSYIQDEIYNTTFTPLQAVYSVLRKLTRESGRIIPFKDDIFEAMWYHNDTTWRTVLDAYYCAMFADKEGQIQDTPQRNHFCILDGIVGGEKNGPISTDPVYPGVLLAGFDVAVMDAVASALMGFDIDRIPSVKHGLELTDKLWPIDGGSRKNIEVIDSGESMNFEQFEDHRSLDFEPHPDWKGHVERSLRKSALHNS